MLLQQTLLRSPAHTGLCPPARWSRHLGGAITRRSAIKVAHAGRPARRVALQCAAKLGVAQVGAHPRATKIGFLGIGIMGNAMAYQLITGGYDVTVWNRTPEKCEALAKKGAKVGATAAEVVRKCDITIAVLADPQAALDVALGPEGVVSAIGPNKGYIDVSTVDAKTTAQIAAAVRGAGGLFLEAPVSGSKGPAEQGQLIFLTAGDKELFEAAEPLLDRMGKAKFFLGDVGAAANMKLIVNMVMGTMMASFAEGLSLAEGAGLSQQDVINVIGLGAIASPMFALKGPTMVEHAFDPAFPLKHQQKDLRLALALGERLGQRLTTAAAANELYVEARQAGLGDSDFSAVVEVVNGEAELLEGGEEAWMTTV